MKNKINAVTEKYGIPLTEKGGCLKLGICLECKSEHLLYYEKFTICPECLIIKGDLKMKPMKTMAEFKKDIPLETRKEFFKILIKSPSYSIARQKMADINNMETFGQDYAILNSFCNDFDMDCLDIFDK